MTKALALILHPPHLRRTMLIAALVGTWLTGFNQGDTLVTGAMTTLLTGKICLNYVSPFVVANLGLLSGQNSREAGT